MESSQLEQSVEPQPLTPPLAPAAAWQAADGQTSAASLSVPKGRVGTSLVLQHYALYPNGV